MIKFLALWHKTHRMLKPLLFISLISLNGFAQISNYPERTGDISFDERLDKKDFRLCYEKYVFQYFNNSEGLTYEGEKWAILQAFSEKYKPEGMSKESGFVRIRFIVNCKGETDRFRILASDENLQEKVFDKAITDQLLQISKELKGWKPKKFNGVLYDYYQYLIFKIENGQIKEILP